MKKIVHYTGLICILLSCQKQVDNFPNAEAQTFEDDAGTSASETYLPLTEGTYWKYDVVSGTTVENSTVKVLGLRKNINGRSYEKVQVVKGTDRDTIFYNQTNEKYFLYTNSSGSGENTDLELLFLYDDKPVGFQWDGPCRQC